MHGQAVVVWPLRACLLRLNSFFFSPSIYSHSAFGLVVLLNLCPLHFVLAYVTINCFLVVFPRICYSFEGGGL